MRLCDDDDDDDGGVVTDDVDRAREVSIEVSVIWDVAAVDDDGDGVASDFTK